MLKKELNKMSSLNVYKASAGSGKTFRLAVEYIKLLITNPTEYRHILAVTFTNKATEEMKERILSQLYGIATGDKGSADYLTRICEELDVTPEHVKQRASEALSLIIHDYSHFQVTTIDSFFQTVMRNMARELGLGAGLNIELDTNSVLSASVDELIRKLDIHSPIFIHLLDYIKELINEEKSWKVIDSIKEFGRDIFNEGFMEIRQVLHRKLKDKDFLPTYKRLLYLESKKSEESLEEIADSFFTLLSDAGVDYTALKGGQRGIGSYFVKLKNKEYSDKKLLNKTVEKCLVSLDEWRSKSASSVLSDELVGRLQERLRKSEELRPRALCTINSCKLALEQINKVGLLAAIDEEVHSMNERKNRFLLAETNILLRQLIQDGDSSFVFEKIGANIRHVMIDEFQDTSRLQWKNFRILLLEGLSQGADSLIVGDVKQAIYRWRSGDWGILNSLRTNLEAFPIREKHLVENRRSEENIIYFNNRFFTQAVEELRKRHRQDQPTDCRQLIDAYKDVCQEFPEEKRTAGEGGKGYVSISFPAASEELSFEEATIRHIGEEVLRLMEQGVKPKDISILVRKNRYIPRIADYFERELPHIPVVSAEAYRLDASPGLMMLMQAIRVLATPDDLIARAHLALLCHKEDTPFEWSRLKASNLDSFLPHTFVENIASLRTMPLYELLEELTSIFDLNGNEEQSAYLFAFFDAVSEYLQNQTADYDSFIRYWEERLCMKTIPAESIEGLHFYSIHNSKGLEFHTVIIPFCNWKMENELTTQSVWCQPPEEPYNHLDLLPIRYGNDMNRSVFHETYLKERLELWVDNLNILYVAFTRARANLIVMGSQEDKFFTVSTLMQECLHGFDSGYSPEMKFELGTLCPSMEKERLCTNRLLLPPTRKSVTFRSLAQPLEFRQSNRSAAFIRGDEEPDLQQGYLLQGSLLHRIFSEVKTRKDVEPLLRQLEMEGLFNELMPAKRIRRTIDFALNHPIGSRWFTSEWEVINECNIVFRRGGETLSRRPDRVMVSRRSGEVVVVDFKFGKTKDLYEAQVREYIRLLQEMGHEQVGGYLWYVYKGEIRPVMPLDE